MYIQHALREFFFSLLTRVFFLFELCISPFVVSHDNSGILCDPLFFC